MTPLDYLLKTKSDLHLPRKIWHATGVLILFTIYSMLDHIHSLQLFSLFLVTSFSLDFIRQHNPQLNKFIVKVFKPIMRKNEEKGFAGTTHLALGVFCTALFFPTEIVQLSLLFLAFADPIASFVGVKWGKDKLINGKSFQGTLAAFLTCTCISLLYYYAQNVMTDRLLIVALLSGFIGALSELIPIGPMDDNLTLPIVSSVFLFGLFTLFSGV